jgi:hypothetical protein
METSLHRQLKRSYARDAEDVEVTWGPYRIDAIRGDELIEVQHGPLAAIRDKVQQLLKTQRVRVVKPLITRKRIIRQTEADGPVTSSRWSPSRGEVLALFDELVFFTKVFPHPRLTLEVVRVEVEEWRLPPEPKRRRRRQARFRIKDVVLLETVGKEEFHDAEDLLRLFDTSSLDGPFNTAQLAAALDRPRWFAQRVAYVLRETGAAESLGRNRLGHQYSIEATLEASRAA